MSHRTKKENQFGFTLIEVMVTVAIIGIIAAIVIPNYISRLPEKRLRASARNLYSDLQKAKLAAIKRNCNVAVVFTVASCGNPLPPSAIPDPSGSYVVFVDNGQCDSNNANCGTSNNNVQDGAEPTIAGKGMLPGVALCNAAFGGTAPPVASFKSQGLPMNPGSIILCNTKKQFTITITNAGVIRTQE